MVSGVLETETRLHIGSGRDAIGFEETDSSVIKVNIDGLEQAYIPGSSIKGIFRSCVENILTRLGIKVCEPYPNDKDYLCKDISREISELSRDFDISGLMDAINRLCLSCKIFGTTNYSSHVNFIDCIPLENIKISTGVAPGIAINRRDGTTIPGGLFNYEYIEPGSRFLFQMQVFNLPNYLIGLLFNVIELINKGLVLIGGKKRAGLGFCKIWINKIEYRTIDTTKVIDFNRIDLMGDRFKIEALKDLKEEDYDYEVLSSEVKGKSLEEFSDLLIKRYVEVWVKHVRSGKG